MVGGSRAATYINRDYFVPHLADLLKAPSLELARLIWRTLLYLPRYPDYLQATYQLNRANGSRYAASRLVHELRAASWVPQSDGMFVRPADAARATATQRRPLRPGLRVAQGHSVRRDCRAQVGAGPPERSRGKEPRLRRRRGGRTLPAASTNYRNRSRSKSWAELESRDRAAVPDRPLANPERRASNAREQALKAHLKETEVRERSVSLGREEVKEEADTFLREHYRNADGEVTCQICKGPLPFKLDDGREYFEVVEFLPELRKRHPQNYLALCLNHSAMYRLVNDSRSTMREAFLAMDGNELAVVLADRDMTIYFSRTHIIDLGAVLDAEDSLSSENAPEEVGDGSGG